MPFCLDVKDVVPEVANFESVLIVPCRFCPAASMAVKNDEPYIEFPRRSLRTASYERLIKSMKQGFEEKGIKTSVFKSNLLHQFVLCMWTAKRRAALKQHARDYDALIVLGCEAAVQTVRDAVAPNDCTVLQGVETEGIMSVLPRLSLPCNLSLEPQSISKYEYQGTQKISQTG